MECTNEAEGNASQFCPQKASNLYKRRQKLSNENFFKFESDLGEKSSEGKMETQEGNPFKCGSMSLSHNVACQLSMLEYFA